jgi:hypothetical protein
VVGEFGAVERVGGAGGTEGDLSLEVEALVVDEGRELAVRRKIERLRKHEADRHPERKRLAGVALR